MSIEKSDENWKKSPLSQKWRNFEGKSDAKKVTLFEKYPTSFFMFKKYCNLVDYSSLFWKVL